MDVTSDKAVDPKTGIVQKPHKPTYTERVELYRRQLWRGTLRQNVGYPHRGNSTKAAFNDKLMKYAARAGMNYMGVFNSEVLKDQDFLIGWAGKKLKAKMREKNRIHLGKKAPKISRRVYKNTMLYLSLQGHVIDRKFIPTTELLASDFPITELVQITNCRNGKKGSLQLLDAEGKYRTIHYQESPNATQADVLLAWAPVTIVKTWPNSSNTTPRPLFRGPRLHPRDPAMQVISESTLG